MIKSKRIYVVVLQVFLLSILQIGHQNWEMVRHGANMLAE